MVKLDNTVEMPSKLTAGNGAKALLIGEFFERLHVVDPDTDEEYIQRVPVSWSTIKSIYQKIVENRQELIDDIT